MKTLKFNFIFLLNLISFDSFSQTTHTFIIDGNPSFYDESVTVLVGDNISIENGSNGTLTYYVNGNPVGNINSGALIFDTLIDIATSPSFNIFVIANNSAYQKTIHVTVSTAGISENTVKYSVYPNPASDFLNIDGVYVQSVKIFDISGQIVLIGNTNKIDVSALQNGIYTIVVNNDDRIKIVKNGFHSL